MLRSTQKTTILLLAASIAIALLDVLSMSGAARSYLQLFVLAGALIASILWMGWARPRTHNSKLIAALIILAAIAFQVSLFLFLGWKLGFVRNLYGWNLISLVRVFLPVTLTLVLEEILRGQLVEHGKGNLRMIVGIGVILWLITILIALPAYQLTVPRAVFTFLVTVAGPAALTNILLTYIAYTYDYRVNIAYRLIMELPTYLLPILPNVGIFLPTLFQVGLIPVLIIVLAGLHHASPHRAVARTQKVRRPISDQSQRTRRIVRTTATSLAVVLVLTYVSLVSGLFRYYVLTIGSGSMEPTLARGDLVLVEKTNCYDTITTGDILVYHHGDAVVVHRVVAIGQDTGQYTFQTQGDHNTSEDDWQVSQQDIIGVARGRIAALGYPTLWVNALFND